MLNSYIYRTSQLAFLNTRLITVPELRPFPSLLGIQYASSSYIYQLCLAKSFPGFSLQLPSNNSPTHFLLTARLTAHDSSPARLASPRRLHAPEIFSHRYQASSRVLISYATISRSSLPLANASNVNMDFGFHRGSGLRKSIWTTYLGVI